MTLYIKDEDDDTYHRFKEEHFQKAYTTEEVRKAVEAGGMKLKKILDADTMKEVTDITERMYVICQEQGKGDK